MVRTSPLGIKVPNSALEFTEDCSLVITILGASGDLAKRKTYPALCTLHSKSFLPRNCKVLGYARSALTNDTHKVRPTPQQDHVPGSAGDLRKGGVVVVDAK